MPNIHSYNSPSFESLESIKKPKASIEKIVNPLGTVTTVSSCLTADVKTDILDEVVSQLSTEDNIIHENCDESLFRPVVAIFCDEKTRLQNDKELQKNSEQCQPPETISNRLVVPVIPKEIDDEISKKEKKKNNTSKSKSSISKNSNLSAIEQKKCVKLSTYQDTGNEDDPNNKTIDTNPTCSKLSLLKSTKKPNLESFTVENICKKEKRDCKTHIASRSDILTTDNNNSIKSSSIESVDVSHIEEIKAEQLKENANGFKRILSKPQKSTDQLKDCDVSEIKKKIDDNTYSNIKELSKNVKSKLIFNKNSITDDAEKQRPTVEFEGKIQFELESKLATSISSNLEKNEYDTRKPTREYKEVECASISLNNTKPSVYQIENKSVCIAKNAKKEKVEKGKEIINKSNGVVTSDKIKNCSKDPWTNNAHKISTILSNTVKTNNSKNPSIKSNLKNEQESVTVIDGESNKVEQKISLKPVIEELQECNISNTTSLLTITTGQTKNSVENVNKDQQNKGTITLASDLKGVKKSMNEGRSKSDIKNIMCERREKLEKKGKSENDSTSKIHDKMNAFVPKIKTEGAVEKTHKCIKSEDIRNEKVSEVINQNIYFQEVKTEHGIKRGDDIKDFSTNISKSKGDEQSNKHDSSVLSEKELSKDEQKTDLNSGTVKTVVVLETIKEKIDGKSLKKCGNSKLKSKEKELVIDNPESNTNQKPLLQKTVSQTAPTSAWKQLSGAEMINKSLTKSCTETTKTSSLEAPIKSNVRTETAKSHKLVPELPIPQNVLDQITKSEILGKTKLSFTLNEDPILNPLETLPPLPSLEPLQLMSENKSSILKDISLINFESPLQENPALERKITPTPRGFTEQNLIFALCGSLHYENENMRTSSEELDVSSNSSCNRSFAVIEEPPTTDYKTLTEYDDPYMSLEQSSQDTNTTNTNTTTEKFSSSTNSSGSEEIVIVEEKKMSKKQKRKRQQLQELQKQRNQQHQQEMDDEELRPLIAMTESQADQTTSSADQTLPGESTKSNSNQISVTQTFLQSTTTDSEGPMPVTTSDDNVFCLPAPTIHNPQKIKTKKLEHKINLIGAIEAATSSSTSSAEESGVEIGGRSLLDNEESLTSLTANISAAASPLVGTTLVTVGSLKKKSKRRKR